MPCTSLCDDSNKPVEYGCNATRQPSPQTVFHPAGRGFARLKFMGSGLRLLKISIKTDEI